MKASEIVEHFFSISDWLPSDTVDGIIVGRADKEVKRAMVTWISSLDAINDAIASGFDAVITHEPTFYAHQGEREMADYWDIASEKKRLVEENDIVVIRNHDCWDKMPEIGIPFAWARFLELGDKPEEISSDMCQHRYRIEPTTFDQLSKQVASKAVLLNEPAVQVVGDGSQMVSLIGIGTGCGCRIDTYREMGCDVSIVCDDGTAWWAELQRAVDLGHPIIRVNHGTSEDPGMVTLARYINDNLPGVTATYRPHQGFYRLVLGEE